MTDTQQQDILEPFAAFPSTIYTIKKPEFLESVSKAADQALQVVKDAQEKNEIYPSVMSVGMIGNPEIVEFEKFIAQSAWTILDAQGYKMDLLNTYVSELWSQEHYKFSSMEQHVHSHGVVLSGFYFLQIPDEGCMAQFHDPRAGKVQASLPEKDIAVITEASNSFFIKPEPGLTVFSNSWLPHSFTRNGSTESVKFIHFNISVVPAPKEQTPAPVVV